MHPNIPRRLQRNQRLNKLLRGPWTAAASRQRRMAMLAGPLSLRLRAAACRNEASSCQCGAFGWPNGRGLGHEDLGRGQPGQGEMAGFGHSSRSAPCRRFPGGIRSGRKLAIPGNPEALPDPWRKPPCRCGSPCGHARPPFAAPQGGRVPPCRSASGHRAPAMPGWPSSVDFHAEVSRVFHREVSHP